MRVTYNGKEYWVSYVSQNAGIKPRHSVYSQCKNRFGTEYERPIKRGSKTFNAVVAAAEREKEK